MSYTMGFYDPINPNDAISSLLHRNMTSNAAGQQKCGLHYYHLDYAVEQTLGQYSECHSFHESSCCKNTTISSYAALNTIYGVEYHIDRCGPMSRACENFFMMEGCFYECDPNAGLYRRYSDEQVAADVAANGSTTWTNSWEMYLMPIKAGFCNDWYAACYNDYFCSDDSGDFFSCAKLYTVTSSPTVASPAVAELARLQAWTDELMSITVIFSFLGLLLIVFVIYVIYRERRGKAMFAPLMAHDADDSHAENINSDFNDKDKDEELQNRSL